jgi:hypothetical protein
MTVTATAKRHRRVARLDKRFKPHVREKGSLGMKKRVPRQREEEIAPTTLSTKYKSLSVTHPIIIPVGHQLGSSRL